jgi:hypothetical protein
MADMKNCDGAGSVIDFVDHSIVSYANPPAFPPRKLSASVRSRVLAESRDR